MRVLETKREGLEAIVAAAGGCYVVEWAPGKPFLQDVYLAQVEALWAVEFNSIHNGLRIKHVEHLPDWATKVVEYRKELRIEHIEHLPNRATMVELGREP